MKSIVCILTILCLCGLELLAQSSIKEVNKSSWTVSVVEVHRLGEDTKWSIPGLEIKYSISLGERLNMQLRGGYINMGERDNRIFPLMLGASIALIHRNRYSINPYLISGPSLLIGNDYAGVFATAETGIELVPDHKGLTVFIGYGKNMLFHSGHTSYIKGGIGYQF